MLGGGGSAAGARQSIQQHAAHAPAHADGPLGRQHFTNTRGRGWGGGIGADNARHLAFLLLRVTHATPGALDLLPHVELSSVPADPAGRAWQYDHV
eukprot:gene3600-biopygen8238